LRNLSGIEDDFCGGVCDAKFGEVGCDRGGGAGGKNGEFDAGEFGGSEVVGEALRFVFRVKIGLPDDQLLVQRVGDQVRVGGEIAGRAADFDAEIFEFSAVFFFVEISADGGKNGCWAFFDSAPKSDVSGGSAEMFSFFVGEVRGVEISDFSVAERDGVAEIFGNREDDIERDGADEEDFWHFRGDFRFFCGFGKLLKINLKTFMNRGKII